MLLADDQHAVEEFAAQGADEAFAGRIHPGSLHGCAQYPGAVCLENGVEGLGEVRPAVAYHEPHISEPVAEGEGEVAGLLHCPLAGGVRGDAAQVHPAGAVLNEYQDIQSSQQHCVDMQEVDRDDPGHLGLQELPPLRHEVARGE